MTNELRGEKREISEFFTVLTLSDSLALSFFLMKRYLDLRHLYHVFIRFKRTTWDWGSVVS